MNKKRSDKEEQEQNGSSSNELDDLVLKQLRSENQSLRKDKEILFTRNWELEEEIEDLKHALIKKDSKLELQSKQKIGDDSDEDSNDVQKYNAKIQQLVAKLALKDARVEQLELREKQLTLKLAKNQDTQIDSQRIQSLVQQLDLKNQKIQSLVEQLAIKNQRISQLELNERQLLQKIRTQDSGKKDTGYSGNSGNSQLIEQLSLKNQKIIQLENTQRQLRSKFKKLQAEYDTLKQEQQQYKEQMQSKKQQSQSKIQSKQQQAQVKQEGRGPKTQIYSSHGFNNTNSNGVPTVKVQIDVGTSRSCVGVYQKKKSNLSSGVDDVGEKSYNLMKSQNDLYQKTIKGMKLDIKKMQNQAQESYTFRQELEQENEWLRKKLKDNKISLDDMPTNFDNKKDLQRSSRKSSLSYGNADQIDENQQNNLNKQFIEERKSLLQEKEGLLADIKKLQSVIDLIKAESQTAKNVNNATIRQLQSVIEQLKNTRKTVNVNEDSGQIDSLKKQIDSLKSQIESLRRQNSELAHKAKQIKLISNQVDQNESATRQNWELNEKANQIELLRRQNCELADRVRSLEKQLQNTVMSTNCVVQRGRKDSEQLGGGSLLQLKKKVKALESQNEQLKDECEQMQEVMEGLKLEKERLQDQLKSKKATKEVKNQRVNEHYVAKGFANLNINGVPTVHVLSNSKNNPNKVGEGSHKSLSKLSKDNKTNVDREQKSFALMKLQNQLFQKTIKNLNIEIKKYQRQLKNNYYERLQYEEENNQLKEYLHKVTKGNHDFVYKPKQFEDLWQMQEPVAKQPAGSEKQEGGGETTEDGSKTELAKQNNNLKREKDQLQQKIASLQAKISELQRSIDKLQKNNSEVQAKILQSNKEKDLLAQKNKSLEKQRQNLSKTIEQLEKSLDQANKHQADEEKDLLSQKNSQLEKEKQSLVKSIQQLKKSQDQAKAVLANNEKEKQNLLKTIQQLEKSQDQAKKALINSTGTSEREELASYTDQINFLKQQIVTLRSDIELKQAEVVIAIQKIQIHQNEASETLKKFKIKQDQNKYLHEQLDQIRNAYLKLKADSEGVQIEDQIKQPVIRKPSGVKSVDGLKLYDNQKTAIQIYLKEENTRLINENKQLAQKYTELFELATASQKLLCQYQMEIGERDKQRFKSPPRQFSSQYRSPPKR